VTGHCLGLATDGNVPIVLRFHLCHPNGPAAGRIVCQGLEGGPCRLGAVLPAIEDRVATGKVQHCQTKASLDKTAETADSCQKSCGELSQEACIRVVRQARIPNPRVVCTLECVDNRVERAGTCRTNLL
jgi:hypothetical protein